MASTQKVGGKRILRRSIHRVRVVSAKPSLPARDARPRVKAPRLIAAALGLGAAFLGAGVELELLRRYEASALALDALGICFLLAGLVSIWRSGIGTSRRGP